MKIIETAHLDPNTHNKSNQSHWIYNGLDCCVTHEIVGVLEKELDDVTRKVYDFSMALHGPVMDMNLRGILVDEDEKTKLIKIYEDEVNDLRQKFAIITEGAFGQAINPNSPKALIKLFYETLNLPHVRKRNAKGEYNLTVDRGALETLGVYFDAELLVKIILNTRDQTKRLGLLKTSIDDDHRFRSRFNIAGTNTGRLASSFSDFDTGSNLQNIEGRLRRIFIPDKGKKFANIDLEQADSRNIGALCFILFGDPTYLDACESGDLHTAVARLCWPHLNWTDDPVKNRQIANQIYYRGKSYRDTAKVLGHGTNYLGTAATMAKNTMIPEDIVKDFQRKYFSAFRSIPKVHQWVENELLTKGYLIGLYGRRRHFLGRLNEKSTLRQAVAFMGQNATSDALNKGMLNVWRNHPEVDLLAQVHDSILVQYDEDREDILLPQILTSLQAPLLLNGVREYVIPAEAKVGWNWANADEGNPRGLTKFKPSAGKA